jgi:hypothetical protein
MVFSEFDSFVVGRDSSVRHGGEVVSNGRLVVHSFKVVRIGVHFL